MTTSSEPPPGDPVAGDSADIRSFMDDLVKPEPPPTSGGFSLASLFLLLTAAGAIALLARNILETKIEPTLIGVHAILGGAVGGIVGAVIGAGYPRLPVGLAVGSFVGTLTGGVCAATSASGGSPWLFCVGAAALVVLGFASRWLHREG
jgi:hypothetical protein